MNTTQFEFDFDFSKLDNELEKNPRAAKPVQLVDEHKLLAKSVEAAHIKGAVSPGNPCQQCRVRPAGVLRDHFHGSEFNACPRKVYLDIVDPQPSEPGNQAFLLDGHTHEMLALKAIERGLKDTGYTIERAQNQTELVQTIGGTYHAYRKIIGHHDGMLVCPDGNKYVIECKAVKENTWKEVLAGNINPIWIGQMQFYMLRLFVQHALLVVKNRVTSNIKVMHFERDKEMQERNIDKLNRVYDNIQEYVIEGKHPYEVLPERGHDTKNNKECRFCSHKDNCWAR